MTVTLKMILHKKLIRWIIGILAAVSCGLVLSIAAALFLLRDFSGAVSCEDFENYAFLKAELPPSAEVFDESCRTALNPTYEVIFSMLSGDLSTFQKTSPVSSINKWNMDTSDSYFSESHWQGTKQKLRKYGGTLTSVLHGEYSDGSILMDVLIDTSDPERTIVHYSAAYVD